eukprot:8742038-Pyramimonas_sp.AAC.1
MGSRSDLGPSGHFRSLLGILSGAFLGLFHGPHGGFARAPDNLSRAARLSKLTPILPELKLHGTHWHWARSGPIWRPLGARKFQPEGI